MSANTFSGPKAIAMLKRIEAFIATNSKATVHQIAAEMDLATGTASNYTRELWLSGAIRKVNPNASGSVGVIWEMGEDPDAAKVVAVGLLPTRRIVKTWAPNHARDVLHCFFFGMPAIFAGAPA